MLSIETTASRERRRSSVPIRPVPVFCADGLIWGDATLLARIDRATPETEFDRPRVLALLSIGAGRPVDPSCLRQIALAGRRWLEGDGCLAHIHLAHARLPRLRSLEDVSRLTTADEMMQAGVAPATMMRAFGLDTAPLQKYDPEQPRVPAGSGPTSGEWVKAIGEAIASVGRALASRAVGTILGELSAEQIASLGAFVGQFAAPTAALGLLVIPSPNNGVSEEGTLPSAPNIGYKFDRPAGRLKLTALDDPDTFVIARLGRDMIFHDVVDNAPIARLLNDRIVFDKGVLEAAKLGNTGNDSDDDVSHAPSGSRDEPRICPRPGPDTPHGSSDAAKDYEDDVHARVNDPPLVTPREFAFKVFNPVQQKDVHIDDCFQTRGDNVDGDMEPGAFAEAKGPGLARQLKNNFMLELGTGLKLRTQAINQREAACIRSIKWYVAEEAAAERIRETFAKHKITSITVSHMAPRQR